MKSLMRLENWIEQLVEEPFVRLFAGRLLPQDVARHLVRALEDGERIGADGTPEVPGRYRVTLNAEDLVVLESHHPHLNAQLASALQALAEHMKVRLIGPPVVLLEARTDLPLRTVVITPADGFATSSDHTRDLDLERLRQMLECDDTTTIKAYLVIQGQRSFDIVQPTVRLGRALDNDVILEDPRVSRYHAQLRCRYGRYILQDLGSSGGTTVNGFPVQEIVLRPGDIISLSGVDLIYAEDDTRPQRTDGNTLTYRPVRA